MREIAITEQTAGQRLDKYLQKYFNAAPKSFLYKMLRKKRRQHHSPVKIADRQEIKARYAKVEHALHFVNEAKRRAQKQVCNASRRIHGKFFAFGEVTHIAAAYFYPCAVEFYLRNSDLKYFHRGKMGQLMQKRKA